MAGRKNLITDVPGLKVGNVEDATICSGVTVLLPDQAAVAAIDVRGGGPGTRESDALGESGLVGLVHGLVLSGGSAFGLSAATGVQSWLAANGVGFSVGEAKVPIVPQAILFDLLNGGNKDWDANPYEAMGVRACERAGIKFETGSTGAGYGAKTANMRGGLGSASVELAGGVIVGAVAAVNAVGSVTMGSGPHFWAHALERDGEFGGLGMPEDWRAATLLPVLKGAKMENTTVAIVATNVTLDKSQARRLAIMAQTGLARAIYPVHTPLDGDVVFALSTGRQPLGDPVMSLAELGCAGADVLARAVARGVYEARPGPACWTGPRAHVELFPEAHS